MHSKSRRDFLLATGPGAAALGVAVSAPAHGADSPEGACFLNVAAFGAVGDGRAHSGAAFQRAIDAAESMGGGIVRIPPGEFLLEKTPLIASGVHLMGSGAATILRGLRPETARGAALISNKGQQARGYDGAHDWSVSHLTINSPDTNGIVVTHAARVYIGHIYGVDVYHHFVDTAGRDILCENLFLTGRSGTSTFQIDSLSGAQTIWDGKQAVSPLLDGTDTENLILQNSIITARAGHTGNHPHHDASVHFHGDEARGFIFSNLALGGAATGFYQDANTAYHDIQISNVRSNNPGRALWLNPGKTRQQNLMVRGFNHTPMTNAETSDAYIGLEIYGREGLLLSDIQLNGKQVAETAYAVRIGASQFVRIDGLQATCLNGRGVWLHDHGDDDDGKIAQTLIHGCMLQGFDFGFVYDGTADVKAKDNFFRQVAVEYDGAFSRG